MNESTSDIRNHIHGFDIGSTEETVHGSKYARILLAVQFQSQQLELNNNLPDFPGYIHTD
jgi:hypothetical protein